MFDPPAELPPVEIEIDQPGLARLMIDIFIKPFEQAVCNDFSSLAAIILTDIKTAGRGGLT